MAVLALTNAFLYIDNHDFTGDTNELMLAANATALDCSNFRSNGWHQFVGGEKDSKLDFKGFWQSATLDSVDTDGFPDLAVSNLVATAGDMETETQPVVMWRLAKLSYQAFGQLNTVTPFSLSGSGTDSTGVIHGLGGASITAALAKAMGTVNATGALGSGLNLGAVSSTQKVYGTFHIFGTPGTTVTVVLESATAGSFAGATTRATLGPLTTAGGTWVTPISGAITDTWWRYRVTAITGTFTVAGAIGIQ